MFIRVYLRASTDDQCADRAKDSLDKFIEERELKVACYYQENISGSKLDRPELNRLLKDASRNDIILIEHIDRLTRLNTADWAALKKKLEEKELRIVSLDIPTTWQALTPTETSTDPVTNVVLSAINNMLIELMAAVSHKDLLTRAERQKQGIKRAKALGKYKGRQADTEKHQKVLHYRKVLKLTISETAELTGYSRGHICRIVKENR